MAHAAHDLLCGRSRARANVDDAARRLRDAEAVMRRAEERTAEAKVRVEAAEKESLRSRLPGRSGAGARSGSHVARVIADRSLGDARHVEQTALREIEATRHVLIDAARARNELVVDRDAQSRREAWLHDHADELRWARHLRQQIESRWDGGPPRRRAKGPIGEARPNGKSWNANSSGHDSRSIPATEAVLRRSVSHAPMHRPRPPERKDPSLGR